MNGYVCFYKGDRIEVRAETTLVAQHIAEKEFSKKFPRRKIKGFEISVMLAERGEEQVTHTPDM